jgi:hypothetical protein
MLPEMVGIVGDSRYFAMFYMGSKATWTDGRGLGTFSYYAVYEPLTEHPALALDLEPYHLGSDDEFPTHAIVCDRLEGKMYVGDYPEVEKFLNIQHPPLPTLSPEEVEQQRQRIEEELANFDISTFQKLGMFELLAGHNQQQKQKLVELAHWLDQQLTEDSIRRYVEAAMLIKVIGQRFLYCKDFCNASIKFGYSRIITIKRTQSFLVTMRGISIIANL